MLVCPIIDLTGGEVAFSDPSRSVGTSVTITCDSDNGYVLISDPEAESLTRTCSAENGWGDDIGCERKRALLYCVRLCSQSLPSINSNCEKNARKNVFTLLIVCNQAACTPTLTAFFHLVCAYLCLNVHSNAK